MQADSLGSRSRAPRALSGPASRVGGFGEAIPQPRADSRGTAAPRTTAGPYWITATLLVAAIYAAVILMAALLWPRPLLLTALYVPLAAWVLYRWWNMETAACFLTGFVLGPAGEFVAVAAGAWSYAGHQRLPLWLPLAWGIAVVVMKEIVVLVGAWRARASPGSLGVLR